MKLINVLNKHLREQREKEPRETDYFRVSGMGQCFRKRLYERTNAESMPLDDRTLRVFMVGNLYHKYLQSVCKDAGVLVESELEVKDDIFNIKGHIDAIVKIGDEHVLYDFKTVNSRKFTYIKKEGDPHYVKQLLTYLWLAPKKYNIKEARLLYISKDDMRMYEQMYTLDDNYIESIKKEMEELNRYLKDEPEEIDNSPMQDWECNYCQYSQCIKNKTKQP